MNTAFWRVREGELGSSAIITLAYRVIQTKIITFWELGRMGRGKRERGVLGGVQEGERERKRERRELQSVCMYMYENVCVCA